MYRVASQQLLVDFLVNRTGIFIGDPDARHVAAFCVSTTIRILRERSIEWRIWQENRERWYEMNSENARQIVRNSDDRVASSVSM